MSTGTIVTRVVLPMTRLTKAGIVLALLVCAPHLSWAQPARATGVSGTVVEVGTAKPIAGGVVAVNDVRTVTDPAGRFALDLPAGAWTIEVSAPRYLTDRLAVTVPVRGRATIEVVLVREAAFAEEISVVAPVAAASPAPATLPVRPVEVTSVAGGGENVFRVLQTLPGVTGTDDFGSRLSVRGGGPDQNLTIMDGVEIHNPYRLFGLTSAFNPETVERFELTAGAFSASYGDRLSSLLVVNNRAGHDRTGVHGFGGAQRSRTRMPSLEGRLPKARGSWIVTARRTYYDIVAERFTDSDLPVVQRPAGQDRVRNSAADARSRVFGLRSREATDASFTSTAEAASGRVFTRSRNDLAAATFFSPVARAGWSRTIGVAYTTTDAFDCRRHVPRRRAAFERARRQRLRHGRHSASPGTATVRDRALRQEFGLARGRSHVLETGFEIHALAHDASASPSTAGATIPRPTDPAWRAAAVCPTR